MDKTTARRYLEEFVYGATDGTVTTFAVIAGATGAGFSTTVALVLGLANLAADGFSMGISAYSSFMTEASASRRGAVKKALVTFASFVVVGSVPLLAYIVNIGRSADQRDLFILSAILSGLCFFCIGYLKGKLLGRSPLKNAVSSLSLGGAAAAVAFVLGNLLERVIS